MIVISLLSARRRPGDAEQVMLQMHAPERLGLGHDRVEAIDTE